MHQIDAQLWLSPSDLTAFLGCAHLTTLARRDVGRGVSHPRTADAELLAAKGLAHERRILAAWRAEGRALAEIAAPRHDAGWPRAAEDTERAMRAGADVIYQGVFVDAPWRGVADFLVKVAEPSALGAWGYEAWDTKLASRAKPSFILQLAFYSEQLERLQGHAPARMHIVPGGGLSKSEAFTTRDYLAYYRRVRRRLLASVQASAAATYPYPVSHCRLCGYAEACAQQWRDADHLCRVAKITRSQVEVLETAGIRTGAALAKATTPAPVGIGSAVWDRLRQQARLQQAATADGRHRYELLRPDGTTGFARLPSPSPGDVFFDMEGDPYFEGIEGLEYLFGAMTVDSAALVFQKWVALSRQEECRAFEEFVDFVCRRRETWPDLHVYHYAAYEKTALRNLAARHRTREREVEQVLAEGVFVDLYDVVRQALRISHDSYSIKAVRTFFMDVTPGAVADGSGSILAFEEFLATEDQSRLDAIIAYNEEDCRSTVMLHRWLLERRAEAQATWGAEIPWYVHEVPAPSDTKAAEDLRIRQQQEALYQKGTNDARVLGDLVAYHRREARPAWSAYLQRYKALPEEWLFDAEAITGLERTEVAPVPDKQSWVCEFRFPPQDVKLKAGVTVFDAVTQRSAGTLVALDAETGWLQLKRAKRRDEPWPHTLVAGPPVDDVVMRRALRRVGDAVLANQPTYRAVRQLLARSHPAVRGRAPGGRLQTMDADAQVQLVEDLDDSYLMVQGPPGSGKTFLAARLIATLVRRGRRVGVSSLSHKAINNLLAGVERQLAGHMPFPIGLKKCTDDDDAYGGALVRNTEDVAECEASRAPLIAGTGWLFSREGCDQQLDYLFVDEAGQLALADVVAMGTSARNLVLLGDPQQLPHIQQGRHPSGADQSVLTYLLDSTATVSPDRGVFLEQTYRLHPDIAQFVSLLAYDGRLASVEVCRRQRVMSRGLSGAGLRTLLVQHEGNAQKSPEEARVLADAIRRLLADGAVTDSDDRTRALVPADIMVVAPYNLHVQLIESMVPAGVQVGTVDKFQGREAPVVFYALATSSAEDAPRGLNFLLDTRRLNVAVSRARALAVLVCSPRLLEATCHSVEQMRMLNGLCLLAEAADHSGSDPH